MNREVCKFMSGSFAALAYAHASGKNTLLLVEREFHDRAAFPWLAGVEAATDAIRGEYLAMTVDRGDLIGNVARASSFEQDREFGKIGKSLKNSVSPDEICEEYGADTLRVYEMSMGPLDLSRPWETRAVVGSQRFLQRLWRVVIDESTGARLPPGTKGVLVIRPPLPPGCMTTVWNDDARFLSSYFSHFKELLYSSLDWAIQDEDGYTFILGRTDDVINVAGHRLGTREIEESVASHPEVAEVAVVGVRDELKGQVPVVFATLRQAIAWHLPMKPVPITATPSVIRPSPPGCLPAWPAPARRPSGPAVRRSRSGPCRRCPGSGPGSAP